MLSMRCGPAGVGSGVCPSNFTKSSRFCLKASAALSTTDLSVLLSAPSSLPSVVSLTMPRISGGSGESGADSTRAMLTLCWRSAERTSLMSCTNWLHALAYSSR
jgi:hypothetical protein